MEIRLILFLFVSVYQSSGWVDGKPLEQVEPKPLQFKLQEPLLLLGKDRFSEVDIRIRVKGGGRIAQIYAIRQALSKALVAYYQKCELCFLEKYRQIKVGHAEKPFVNRCVKIFTILSNHGLVVLRNPFHEDHSVI